MITNIYKLFLLLSLIGGELLIPSTAFNQPEQEITKAKAYITTAFSAAIFPADVSYPKLTNRFSPSEDDVFLAERALSRDMADFRNSIIKQSKNIQQKDNLLIYNRQYFGFKNEQNQKILLINAFGNIQEEQLEKLDWLNQVVSGNNKVKGMLTWTLYYNLDEDKLFEPNAKQPEPEETIATLIETTSYTTAIFPENFAVTGVSNRITPTEDDIFLGERALSRDLMLLNKDLKQQEDFVIHRNLLRYYRQYIGYTNEKGEKILVIFAFWKVDDESVRKLDWLNKLIIGKQGGKPYWNVKYNVDRNILFDLKINSAPF